MSITKLSGLAALILAAAPLLSAAPALATTQIFTGKDDGAPPEGPFSSSRAAEAAFLAAASGRGAVTTNGFEDAPLGFYSPLILPGVTISFDSPDFGPGFSGVTVDSGYGNSYGFNVTEGGSQWLGFPGFEASTAHFDFETPTYGFGFYTTGVQDLFTSDITVELLDGSRQIFNLSLNSEGGASYFGLVDLVGFSRVSITQTNNPGYADAWGIDNISFNSLTSNVPEPATWAMLIAGFGMVGMSARRRNPARSAA